MKQEIKSVEGQLCLVSAIVAKEGWSEKPNPNWKQIQSSLLEVIKERMDHCMGRFQDAVTTTGIELYHSNGVYSWTRFGNRFFFDTKTYDELDRLYSIVNELEYEDMEQWLSKLPLQTAMHLFKCISQRGIEYSQTTRILHETLLARILQTTREEVELKHATKEDF